MKYTGILTFTLVALFGISANNVHAGEIHAVCSHYTGQHVQAALNALSVETADFPDRCRYIVSYRDTDDPQREAILIWEFPVRDFAEFRKYVDAPVDVEGLGDGAFTSFDSEDQRYSLFVLKPDRATLQITGEDLGRLRQVAKMALALP